MLALLAEIFWWYVASVMALIALALFWRFLENLKQTPMSDIGPMVDFETRRARAMALLRSWLTARQIEQLDRYNCFLVNSNLGNYFVIGHGVDWNVRALNAQRRPREMLCFQPSLTSLYEGDVMLAQKILLETDEAAVWRVANTSANIDARDYSFLFTMGEPSLPPLKDQLADATRRAFIGRRSEPALTDPIDY